MNKRHYYAIHTPFGDVTDDKGTPLGTIIVFDSKRARDEWVEDNYYHTLNGNPNQTRAITEHEARVTMLRQWGHEMCSRHNRHGLKYSYREYAQYYPTALMVKDYEAITGDYS